ncbi:MAG: hypothetical protein M3O36_12985 [Myxococcota bacterium]|nr:hypothetical protein [Myxococcota bacterium]
MSIAGTYPESGVRIDVQRLLAGGPPWLYEGEAVTPSRRFRVAIKLEANGTVTVELEADAPPAIAAKARLIVRAAWKHAQEDAVPPPRRIMRWRAER